VLLVGHDGNVVYRKAYGKRALVPSAEAMTVDTIFDLASLTKVVATTTSLMKLFEEGRFRLNDRVTAYIPEFQGGKSDITLRNLFTHFSGLRPDVPLAHVPTLPPGRRGCASSIATSTSFCWGNWYTG
jgi:CubicO group peptidase (beta-lactamase class C family)